MPLYTVSTHKPLDETQKQKIVAGITRIHCQLTNAPAMFVQVVFSFNVPLNKNKKVHLIGSIRSGRSGDLKQKLIDQFKHLFSETLAGGRDITHIVLIDVPASWILEGGEIMPEPGEEAAWLKRLNLS